MPQGLAPQLRAAQIAEKMKLAWEHATLRPPGLGVTLLALLGYGAVIVAPALFALVVAMASSHSRVTAAEEGGVTTRT